MPSPSQIQSEIARLNAEEATQRKHLSDAQADASRAVAAARDKRARAARASTSSQAATHLREAERLDRRAADLEKKAANAAKKLADVGRRRAARLKALESAEHNAERNRNRDDERRRQAEKRHAREVARLAQPVTKTIHEVRMLTPPKPERLRVLYLATNPAMDLRVDVEVRMVREAVRRALHRDLLEIDHRPAATPEDLLDGLNEVRPHVVHFSGHGGEASVLFDDAGIEMEGNHEQPGRPVSFDWLARAVGATDSPPILLVLNACDTLEGAEVLLGPIPVVLGMSTSVTDLAAGVFAARFYSAIASAQSIGAALEQGRVAVEAARLEEGWAVDTVSREDVDVANLILVRPQGSDEA
jgi:hypothetical protein